MPIIEAAASDVTLGLAGQAHSQQLSSQCGMKLHVDVYNNALMGWEPLLEPWASSVALQVPLARYDSPSEWCDDLQQHGVVQEQNL